MRVMIDDACSAHRSASAGRPASRWAMASAFAASARWASARPGSAVAPPFQQLGGGSGAMLSGRAPPSSPLRACLLPRRSTAASWLSARASSGS